MMKQIAGFILYITGWKTKGAMPALRKFVVILAPHTSGADFLYAMCARFIFGIQLSFLGKREVFRFPFGFIFRWLGGVPVDRSSRHNLVDQAVRMFEEHEQFILALSPEGTRAYVAEWKTGFYYIALKAKVPIVLTYLDYEHKTVGIGPVFYPTGDKDRDIAAIKDFYRPIKGKYPEKGVR